MDGSGAASRVEPGGVLMGTAGAAGETVPPAVLRNSRRSSAMSRAVVYRSVARFEIAFRQMRSSSLGIVSSIWRGGRASVVAIRSMQFVASFVFVLSFGDERSSTGQQLVEDHAQAEDVRTTIDTVTLASCLLGTHVSRSSSDPGTLAEVLILECKTEVGHEGVSRSVDQDVGGLDVPVDQSPGVGVVKGFGDRRHQFRRLVKAGASFP